MSITDIGTVYPMGHTGELRKTKEENRELKARVVELEEEVKRQHEGWTDCNAQLDLASRDAERYREALEKVMEWAQRQDYTDSYCLSECGEIANIALQP